MGSYSGGLWTLNNFKLYTSADGINYTEYITQFTLIGNTITLGTPAVAIILPQNNVVVVQLKMLDGGNFGLRDAYGVTVLNKIMENILI